MHLKKIFSADIRNILLQTCVFGSKTKAVRARSLKAEISNFKIKKYQIELRLFIFRDIMWESILCIIHIWSYYIIYFIWSGHILYLAGYPAYRICSLAGIRIFSHLCGNWQDFWLDFQDHAGYFVRHLLSSRISNIVI